MKTTLIYVAIAFAAGIAVTLAIPNTDPGRSFEAPAATLETLPRVGSAPTPQTPAVAGRDPGLAELERRLESEIGARRELERKLEALQRQVAELEQRGASDAADTRARQVESGGRTDGGRSGAWFDEQALIASGMDSVLAGELKQYFERLELERLQLRDRAAREGWDRARRRAGLDALDEREQGLRERLGESGYDAYLYAAGRPNRVAVTSVLASAPAGQAGILAGDFILRYDNERIYDWSDLRAATTAGNVSELVAIEVERDGERLQFYLARGPLGVRTDSLSLAP